MTIAQALNALRVIDAIPLTGSASYVPSLILIRADLRRVARDAEPQRVDLVEAAKEAAGVPDTFDSDLAKYMEAPESVPGFKTILDKVDAHFAPAWERVTAATAPLRFPLLTPAQFRELYADLAGREDFDPGLIDAVADLLVE